MSIVREPVVQDEAVWRQLWVDYIRFYEASVPEEVTQATWSRILDPASPVFALLAEREGQVIGFAVSVLHECTWRAAPVCYLEDLFVDPRVRGSGAGHALISHLIALGKSRGWSRLYWHTRRDNAAARRLYDRFLSADDFVRYRQELS
jgi:GNAT superfamily N-acetyltransferase